jgi:hypothetical protein
MWWAFLVSIAHKEYHLDREIVTTARNAIEIPKYIVSATYIVKTLALDQRDRK